MCSPIGSSNMKTPRVSDFDPKAVPSLKSPLDDMPAIATHGASHPPLMPLEVTPDTSNRPALAPESTPELPPARSAEAPSVRTDVRVKRTITRYAFEFFQDQIENLKKLSLEEQLRGEKGSMSQMVREALDAYISQRQRTEA